jgi:hypothetical protein
MLFPSYLEFQMVDKVQNPSDCEGRNKLNIYQMNQGIRILLQHSNKSWYENKKKFNGKN